MAQKFMSLALAAAMALSSAASNFGTTSATNKTPRLVVGILVEGLTEAGLEQHRDQLTAEGLGKLMNRGTTLAEVDYGEAKGVAATAMLMTGALPHVNGIDASETFDRDALRRVSIFNDPSYIGNFTSETLSPMALKVTTFTDESRIASGGVNRVYSIAADPVQALLTAGHSGGSAIWINDTDGRWSTSTFYTDVPAPVTQRNYRSPLQSRLDTIAWSAGKRGADAFRYTFPRSQRDRFRNFKLTPRAGDEITDLGCDILSALSASSATASPDVPDILTITLSVAEYPYATATGSAAATREQADAYTRLDQNIAKIIDRVARTTGLESALIYVAGIPSPGYGRSIDAQRYHVPSGDFSARKARTLLNMYLMAVHGNGDWILDFDGTKLYLNNNLIKERGLDAAAFHREAAEFMSRMEGVAQAVAIEDLLLSQARKYINTATAPDVTVSVSPGWRLTETAPSYGVNTSFSPTLRATPSASPLLILGPGIEAQTIDTPVDATAIAPTLSRLLRVKAPNAATANPLRLVKR